MDSQGTQIAKTIYSQGSLTERAKTILNKTEVSHFFI